MHDVTTSAFIRAIPLQDFDTWVWGISVADGKLHIIDDGRGAYAYLGVRIAVFDPVSGTNLQNVFLNGLPYSHVPSGLWCEVY